MTNLNDTTGFWTVDAYRTDDPDEACEVVAFVDDASGRVQYVDRLAASDPACREAVAAKVAEIKTRLAEEAKADAEEAMAREMALAECVFDLALEGLRSVPGLGDGTADSRAVFQAVYAAAKALSTGRHADYPEAARSAAITVAERFGGPASVMRIAVRDGEHAELVRPLVGGLELSANIDAGKSKFGISVTRNRGTENELDLAVVERGPGDEGEDALMVKAYTDANAAIWGMPAVMGSVPLSEIPGAVDEEVPA